MLPRHLRKLVEFARYSSSNDFCRDEGRNAFRMPDFREWHPLPRWMDELCHQLVQLSSQRYARGVHRCKQCVHKPDKSNDEDKLPARREHHQRGCVMLLPSHANFCWFWQMTAFQTDANLRLSKCDPFCVAHKMQNVGSLF